MAAAIIPIASTVIPLVSSLLPSIIGLFQHVHPVPPDATAPVKNDLNKLKAEGVLDTVMTIIQQLATAGKIPVSPTDQALIAAVAGAIESTYQQMKASGSLNPPPVQAGTGTTAPPVQAGPGGTTYPAAGAGPWNVVFQGQLRAV